MSKIYRFFTETISDSGELEKDVVLSNRCEPAAFEQLAKVLRVKVGDSVVLVSGKTLEGGSSTGGAFGREYRYEVISAHKKEVSLSFKEKVQNKNELSFKLELILCLPNKPDKLSFILQKAVELGVSSVVVVDGDFSQMKHALREDRLQKIMKEAAEQSERAYVPRLELGGKLGNYLESCARAAQNPAEGSNPAQHSPQHQILVAMERENSESLPEILKDVGGDFSILVGPEGGFSDEEKEFVRTRGLKIFSLGQRILRTETAAVVSLGIASLKG